MLKERTFKAARVQVVFHSRLLLFPPHPSSNVISSESSGEGTSAVENINYHEHIISC